MRNSHEANVRHWQAECTDKAELAQYVVDEERKLKVLQQAFRDEPHKYGFLQGYLYPMSPAEVEKVYEQHFLKKVSNVFGKKGVQAYTQQMPDCFTFLSHKLRFCCC